MAPLPLEFLVYMTDRQMEGFSKREYRETYTPKPEEGIRTNDPVTFDGQLFHFGMGNKTLGTFSLAKKEQLHNRHYPIIVSCYPLESLLQDEKESFPKDARNFFRRCACHVYDLNGKPLLETDKKGI